MSEIPRVEYNPPSDLCDHVEVASKDALVLVSQGDGSQVVAEGRGKVDICLVCGELVRLRPENELEVPKREIKDAGRDPVSDKTPDVYVQWQGVEICADLYCECGHDTHIDGCTFGYLECESCDRAYELDRHPAFTKIDRSELP